jgi:DNA-binding NarL/FixJ family response regulator
VASPLHITLVDDSDLATEGLRALLAPYADRVVVMSDREAIARPQQLDAVLYEPMHRSAVGESLLRTLLNGGTGLAAAYSWAGTEELPAPSTAPHLSKSLSASQLVVAVEDLVAGRLAEPSPELPSPEVTPVRQAADRAAAEVAQLTQRELDVVTMVTRGCSNREVAERLGLSLNSVKTYIRTAYRKIGAERRTQAVLWGIEHGLGADPEDDSAMVC